LVNAMKESFFKRYGLVFGAIALIAICLMPTPEGLPVAGKRMLAILLFSVIVWMTDSISYPVSAVVITALMAFLVGMSPDVANPKAIYGTTRGLRWRWEASRTPRSPWSARRCLSPPP
jgi:sodium-dependent dicarboxylate transporter 2/3/5